MHAALGGFLMNAAYRSRLALFALINALLLSLLSLRYLQVIALPSSGLTAVYITLAWLGQGFFLALPLLTVWQLARVAHVIPRTRFVFTGAAILAASLIAAVAAADTIVYQLYRFHIDGVVIAMLQAGNLIEFLSLTPWQLALFAGTFGVLLLLQFVLWQATKFAWADFARVKARRGLGFIAICWFAGHIMFAWGSAVHETRVTALHGALAWQPVLTMDRFLAKLGVTSSRSANLDIPIGGTLRYPLEPVSCGVQQPLNVVIILVDAWRMDALRADIMPNVSRLSAGAQRFENHFSSSSSTRGGVFSLFYGLPPTYWLDALNQGVEPVLMRCLREAGYTFSVNASAPLTNPEFDRTVFLNVPGLQVRTPGEFAAERDRESTRRFLEFLEINEATPFFGFLFYDAAHAYDVPDGEPYVFEPSWDEANYLRLRQGTDPVPFVNLYRNAIYYIDREIGKVLAALEAAGRMNDTVILVTGDHAQEFNDNGLNYWGHNSNFSDAQTHVPLLLYWPGKEPASFTHMTTHYDIAPTLLNHVLGATANPKLYSEGVDLYSPQARLPMMLANYADYALKDENGYMLVDRYQTVSELGKDYRSSEGVQLDSHRLKTLIKMRTRFTSGNNE